MNAVVTRRAVAAAAVAGVFCRGLRARAQAPMAVGAAASNATSARVHDALAALETRSGGRLGVVVLDTGSEHAIGYRAEERFAMCSTFKFLAAAAILTMVDQGRMELDRRVPFGPADLLEYAPIARKHVAGGFMTVDALCEAAIQWSDNTAANLLLALIGGPSGWTRYARSIGDATSRLDRTEPGLNSAIADDPRDTTTPDAMVRDVNLLLLGKALRDVSRARLTDWMLGAKVTDTLLRAGLPNGWRVGDKSGSGERGTRNDIGIILPPRDAPIVAAVYYTESAEPSASRDKVIAEVGRIIARNLGT
ncbi:MAG TPA: class A beta-lactamase [Acetobacteraceae bacterium]|nr:class A beta-lactamase [Acetobacteraceae bacterium]